VEEIAELTRMMLKWVAKKARWRYFRASILVQVFNQLDRLELGLGRYEQSKYQGLCYDLAIENRINSNERSSKPYEGNKLAT
jgi:hypothetical protein